MNFEDFVDILEQRQDIPEERSRLETEIQETARRARQIVVAVLVFLAVVVLVGGR